MTLGCNLQFRQIVTLSAHWGHESSEKVIGIRSPGIQSIAQCFYRVSFEIFCVFMPLDVVMMLIAMEVVRNEYLFCGL